MNYQFRYISMLRQELADRVECNGAYSLRAFSRDLAIQPARMSLILRGQQGLSLKSAKAIVQRLKWSEKEQDHFCDLVSAGSARSKAERDRAIEKITKRMTSLAGTPTLVDDEFRIISDWYFFSFIELTKTENFKPESSWIAERLSLSASKVDEIVKCLIRMKMIDERTWKENGVSNISLDGVPSRAIRKFNKQILAKATDAIEEQAIDERHLSTLTVAVPSELLPELFAKISQFRRDLDLFIDEKARGLSADEVYCFSSQFFRITNKEKEQ